MTTPYCPPGASDLGESLRGAPRAPTPAQWLHFPALGSIGRVPGRLHLGSTPHLQPAGAERLQIATARWAPALEGTVPAPAARLQGWHRGEGGRGAPRVGCEVCCGL